MRSSDWRRKATLMIQSFYIIYFNREEKKTCARVCVCVRLCVNAWSESENVLTVERWKINKCISCVCSPSSPTVVCPRWSKRSIWTSFLLIFAWDRRILCSVLQLFYRRIDSNGTGMISSAFFSILDFRSRRSYVGAPRALLARRRPPLIASNSTEIVPKGRLFGNIFECPNGTQECRPMLIESQSTAIYCSLASSRLIVSSITGDLAQSMPLFHNVLDDAWLGSSLVATSDDSLVVRNRASSSEDNERLLLDLWLSFDA